MLKNNCYKIVFATDPLTYTVQKLLSNKNLKSTYLPNSNISCNRKHTYYFPRPRKFPRTPVGGPSPNIDVQGTHFLWVWVCGLKFVCVWGGEGGVILILIYYLQFMSHYNTLCCFVSLFGVLQGPWGYQLQLLHGLTLYSF